MQEGYKIKDQNGMYFITIQIVNWIDIFTRRIYRDIIIDSFKYSIDNKGFDVFAYVIMSNHVHLLCKSNTDDLSGTIRDIKSFTSKQSIPLKSESPKFSKRQSSATPRRSSFAIITQAEIQLHHLMTLP